MLHRCDRCGRRYPSRLEMTELKRPDGSIEVVCRVCQATSRCEVCGFVSDDRRKFGIRKVEGAWRVVCTKCIEGRTGPAPRRPGARGPRRGG
jgi:hypothetical protein